MASEYEQAAAAFDDRRPSVMDRARHVLHANPTAAPLFVPALALVAFGLIADSFFTVFNVSPVVQQAMAIRGLGVAQAPVILTAGADPSVAAIALLSSAAIGHAGFDLFPGTIRLARHAGFATACQAHALSRGLPIRRNMPHVFGVADRIHIHRLGTRRAVIRPGDHAMSDAEAIMTGAMTPPETETI